MKIKKSASNRRRMTKKVERYKFKRNIGRTLLGSSNFRCDCGHGRRTSSRKRTHTAYRSRKRGAHRGTRHGRGWYEIRLDFVTDALRGRLAPPAVAADLPQDRPQPGLAFQPRLLPAMETGDRAPRTAGLARMLGRGLQPATPANEGTVELQQLVRCRTGLPNRSTARRAGQGYGPGAVSGPPAATSADPLPSKATVHGLA